MNEKILLSKLKPFKNNVVTIKKHQEVSDIIVGMMDWHQKYKSEYDKIYQNFLSSNNHKTFENIFNFLKNKITYQPEPEENQRLLSPSAIITLKNNDCKNFALFIGGLLGAMNRHGFAINYVYRFASYSIFDKTPGHVFIVINPGKNEFWIDPVMNYLNDKSKKPYFYEDYKPKDMLKGISGVINVDYSNLLSGGSGMFGQSSTSSNSGDLVSSAANMAANLIVPGAGTLLTSTGLDKLFSKNGVDSSFFSKFPFLNFLDNSTHQWKSRVAMLRNLTPDQILSWYLKGQMSGNFDVIDAEQYANQWSHKPDIDKVRNNDQNVSFDLAAAYNQLLENKYFKGNNIVPGTNWSREDLMIPLSTTQGYDPSKLTNQNNSNSTTSSTSKKAGIGLVLGLGLVAAYFFTKKSK